MSGTALTSRERPRRPEVWLFALALGVYSYFYQGGGWNQNCRFDLTRALIEHHTVSIDRFAYNTGDVALRGDHAYCDKAPGVSLLGAVPYAVIDAAAGSRSPGPSYLAWSSWASTVFAVALPSAIAVVALCWLLEIFGLVLWARLAIAAAWGLASLALPYSTLYYGHQTAAALLVIAFALLARMVRELDHRSVARLTAAGASLGFAVVTEYPAAIAAAVLASYAARTLRVRENLWLLAGAAVPLLVLAGYHVVAFGAPWHLPYAFSAQHPPHVGFFGIARPDPSALWGITLSSYRGLFFSAPWLLLAIPGAVLLWRRGARAETIACVTIVAAFLWMNASLVVWHGGRAFGPRHLVPCVPFLAVLVGGCLAPPTVRVPRWALVPIVAAVLWSAFLQLAGTAVQPEVDGVIGRPFGDYILPRLAHGEVATSNQSIDAAVPDADGARSAWNLGNQLGLDGTWSLLPLLAWCVVTVGLLRRRVRQAQSPL